MAFGKKQPNTPANKAAQTTKVNGTKVTSTKAASKIRDTMQKSIPYVRVYADTNTFGGVIETVEGTFTKSYYIDDANYSDIGNDEQEDVLQIYEKMLNGFNPLYNYELTINNKNIDQKKFNKEILMELKGDDEDNLRVENNEIFLASMQEGKNNMRSEKYLTVSLDADDIRDALSKFSALETDINAAIKRINGSGIKAMSIEQRLEALHDIYNIGSEGDLFRKKTINGQECSAFNLESIRKQGLTTKDAIGPSSFDFTYRDYMMVGDKYARAMFLKTIPTQLSSTFLESLASVPTNMVISVYYKPISQEKAAAFASGQVTNIAADVIKAQKSLTAAGASPDLISPKLKTAQDDASLMLDELTNGNKKLFHMTLVLTLFADSKEDLKLFSEQIKTKAREVICNIDTLSMQQEAGLNATLPLCVNKLNVHKVMTSYTTAALQPFASKEICHPGGIYYGVNTQTKNMIMYNRLSVQNQNSVILGVPGAGKSFIAKNEMQQVYLAQPNSQVFVIDPEREYVVIAKKFHGDVVRIAPGSDVHVNPFDLDMTKDSDGDPLAVKIDFIISICERMLGPNTVLPSYTKSLIDRTLQKLYEPYLAHLQSTGKTIDREAAPTLMDFYNMLHSSREDEARQFAASIEMYCTGTLNLFAHKTNINPNAKFIVYDISDIGSNLQDMGMQICLNDIWNRMIKNKSLGIRTWFYIDEFYLMLRMAGTAAYLQMVWKRARKWMGVPTGLTQNATDLLNNEYGIGILSTSEFVIMLNQSPVDRPILAELFNISPEQQEYISNAPTGTGLLRCGPSKIPFTNRFPTDTELYKIMSTKPADAERMLGVQV